MSEQRRFSENEINNIIKDYSSGMTPKDLGIKYNRNSGTIIGKLIKIGIYNNVKFHFTNEDIDFLKIYYPKRDWENIFKRFPDANKQQISSKMSSLNIKMDTYHWSNEEIDVLRANYCTCDNIKDLIDLFNNKFTYKAITTKAKRLGIKTRELWSDKEVNILKLYYPTHTLDDIELLLPKRNRKTIIAKAADLNIRNFVKYSKEQENFIIENWKSMSDEEIAIQINKPKCGVIAKRLLLGLLRTKETSSYNDLSEYVRRNNIEWKKKSIKACKYKCYITGDRFQAIHHVYGLNLILNETLDELGILIKNSMDDYTDIELRDILDTFRCNQDKYPLGICLRDDIHKLFHNTYGYGNNTPEQWNEFIDDINKNKYDIINLKTA